MTATCELVELDMTELDELLERAQAGPLGEEEYTKLRTALHALAQLVKDQDATIGQLRQLLSGRNSEKTRKVLGQAVVEHAGDGNSAAAETTAEDHSASGDGNNQGHGRNGASAYGGARKIRVVHESIKWGDRCALCNKGKVYGLAHPAMLVRIVGQVPLQAAVYELQKLRCNLCGEVFTAAPPPGVGQDKYDATAGSMMALLKYGTGLPFHRQEKLQQSLGIPLPASTQWDIVSDLAAKIEPVYKELIREAAQGDVVHNDDTSMKILELMKDGRNTPAPDGSERTGVFTSGIVSTRQGQRMALFFTGRKHAGENLADVLSRRAAELAPPIQMCDALSRNLPKELEAILANCLAHGRRRFVDVAQNFPEECRHVLETLGEVYKNDALARQQGMSSLERLSFHQAQSAPLLEGLKEWMGQQLAERKVEPNSGLGMAISYMFRHWSPLTLFLRQAGAPIDNNVCERALKKVILHRKNALFFKTQNGAHVGDVFMSLIHTCQLAGANPFDYLTELQKHAVDLAEQPQQWMPWNYRQQLEAASVPPHAPG